MYFSEELRSIEELDSLNLTSISNDQVFNVLYSTKVESSDEQQQLLEEGINQENKQLSK